MRKYLMQFIAICISIYLIINLQNKANKNYNDFYTNKIIGIIDSVHYGVQSQAIIMIDNSEYDLSFFNITKNDGLIKGDSFYKKRNSKVLELHSKSSNGYIYTRNFELKK